VAFRADVDFSAESTKFNFIDASGRPDRALSFTFNTFLNLDTVCFKTGRPVGGRTVLVALGIFCVTAPSEEIDVSPSSRVHATRCASCDSFCE